MTFALALVSAAYYALVRANLAPLVHEVEDMIRANPSQWLWIHRRFKNLKC